MRYNVNPLVYHGVAVRRGWTMGGSGIATTGRWRDIHPGRSGEGKKGPAFDQAKLAGADSGFPRQDEG